MCGIAGIYSKKDPVSERLVRAMTGEMHHRGPMEEGYFFAPGPEKEMGMGMRRLSIIDVEGGHQPVFNEDGTIAVVFNGEIYNYRELREELLRLGHRFATISDTEVIVHLYEEMGEAALSRFNGMFAFALWDGPRRKLFVARDRLGVKPLYYYKDPEWLAFASEMKSLLACPFVPREPDREALADYLTFLYMRGPRSPFEGVRKLMPGHYLVADSKGTHIHRYWDLAEHCAPSSLSEPDLIEKIRWLLDDSVRLRLRSDVPVGAFLSGGLDSSAVVAFAAHRSPRPLETFSVGFGDGSFNELGYARTVARAFGTEHHETVVGVEDVLQHLPTLVWHLDEPNADSAIVPTYLVSQFAASRLRVILSGLGGDELFGGYSRYFDGHPMEHLYRRLPGTFRDRIIGPALSGLSRNLARRVERNALPDEERYLAQVSYTSPAERSALLGASADGRASLKQVFASYPCDDPVNRRMFVDLLTYLPDDILHLTDRMSMAVSIEARTPFLDYRLVEFTSSLPGQYKVGQKDRRWKILFKKAMAPLLPSEIIGRVKWGFGAPVLAWMKGKGGLLPTVRRMFQESEAVRSGLLDAGAVREQLSRFDLGVVDAQSAQRAWTLLVLETWARVFLGPNKGARPHFTLSDLL